MIDQCEKHVNLEKFVFDEKNHEQKAWKLFGVHEKISFSVFVPIFCYSFLASVCNRSNYVIHNM